MTPVLLFFSPLLESLRILWESLGILIESFRLFLEAVASGVALLPAAEATWPAVLPAIQGVAAGMVPLVLGILITAVTLVVFFVLAPNTIVGYIVYVMHLKRTKKTKWSRECSEMTPIQMEMYEDGVAWSDQHAEKKTDVHIVNEGLNLYGEFYDFGSSKTAILVAGRTEGLRYNYFFARPYAESGYNILTIDNRAHGMSDGKYNTVGFEEHKDLLAWAKYVHEHHHTDSVVFHGICIGSAGSLYAMTKQNSPAYLKAIVADGMYPSFYESFRNHMIELKKPLFGLPFIVGWMKVLTGHSMKHGPIDVIQHLDRPILMLHGKQDLYSLPSEAERLYEKCGSAKKQLVWFEEGTHSHLRYRDPEKYDAAIKTFLKDAVEDSQSAA